jgi:rhodanese-related sulfurtransferase
MQNFVDFVIHQWILFLILVVIIALLVKSFVGTRGVKNIQPFQAVQLINHQNAVVLDVRLDDEFKQGHVVNSIHIPVGVLQNRIKELEKYKSRPIIVNCRSGSRSATACSVLRKQGFESVYKLEGGILSWQNANLPLNKT